jgi:hypothetical protein
MADYIPAADAEFHAWQQNFVSVANANLAGLGLVAGDMTPITAAQTTWGTTYPAHVTAAAAATSARTAKDGARAAYVALLRSLVRRLQASPQVDDAERAALGITVPDPGSTPVGPPTSRPVVAIECAGRLRHTLNFTDEGTPTRKAKPAGVLGAEVWVNVQAIGQPTPTDPATFTFVALDTRTPFPMEFDAADGGKNANYLLRWVSTTGEKGPWSETATATIGA